MADNCDYVSTGFKQERHQTDHNSNMGIGLYSLWSAGIKAEGHLSLINYSKMNWQWK